MKRGLLTLTFRRTRMELGLTAADALAHLFGLFRATPSGKRVVDGTLKLVALDSIAVAIRATAGGDAKMKTALTAWAADANFEALATTEDGAKFTDAVDEFRFIAGTVVGPVARETADETVRRFCDEWKKAVLGEQNYAKEQIDAARDERRQKQDEATLAVILREFAGTRELIERQSAVAAGASSSSSGKVAERLAEARDIMDRDPKRAREICRDLRKYETLTADEAFRVATNIGVASLRLADFATADVELQEALQLQPTNPKALYNAASVALRQDRVPDAVQLHDALTRSSQRVGLRS